MAEPKSKSKPMSIDRPMKHRGGPTVLIPTSPTVAASGLSFVKLAKELSRHGGVGTLHRSAVFQSNIWPHPRGHPPVRGQPGVGRIFNLGRYSWLRVIE